MTTIMTNIQTFLSTRLKFPSWICTQPRCN